MSCVEAQCLHDARGSLAEVRWFAKTYKMLQLHATEILLRELIIVVPGLPGLNQIHLKTLISAICSSETHCFGLPTMSGAEVCLRAREAHSEFKRLLHEQDTASPSRQGHDAKERRHVIEDAFERYQLWAGNLGAFHRDQDARSLGYRLRNSQAVRKRIVELLEELLESQQSRKSLQ